MKGEIVEISTLEDEFKSLEYRTTIIFKEKPKFRLGECEVKQN